MAKNSYSFEIGNFECLVISDGGFAIPHDEIFTNAPVSQVEQLLRKHNIEPGVIAIQANCLLVKTGQTFVLLDTGFGPNFEPSVGKLVENLEVEGIKPADIDVVINSHAHLDHIGGNTDAKGKPVFPNARYILSKEEREFWASEPSLGLLEVADSMKEAVLTTVHKNLPLIQEQFDIVDYETEILPGIKAMPAPGHTPGHVVLTISSGNEQLLCMFDIAHYPFQLEQPDWYFHFDIMPERAVLSRRQFLTRAANDKILVWAYHFPFPGLGHIIKEGETWRWKPILLRV
jgi:glyoxylase-like metal-dependent hydrolase (beta-lactamase superfamily II)